MMPIIFIATCLTSLQAQACANLGIDVANNYAKSYGEIKQHCITDFSVHCFNSTTLDAIKNLGAKRATLHPELNLAQIRDIIKPINTEVIIYGKLPLMKLGNPIPNGYITDRTGARFYSHEDMLYNSVPIFMADKLKEIEKAGVTHGRLFFTTETAEEVRDIIKAYMYRKMLKTDFTRGKFYSKV